MRARPMGPRPLPAIPGLRGIRASCTSAGARAESEALVAPLVRPDVKTGAVAPSLSELQRAFAAGILDETPEVLPCLQQGRFGAARHLQVYRNNTFTNLTEALAAIYPVVQRLVGEGFFAFAANEYIRTCPPRAGNLHEFGDRFAPFLAGFEPANALSYLPDVARLEWAWHRAFHAADHRALDPARFAAIPPDRYGGLTLRLQPAAQLLSSAYPILRIWQVNQPGYSGSDVVDLAEGGVQLLVARRALDVEIEPLTVGAFAWLQALASGTCLAEACDAAFAAEPDFDLRQTLQRHIGQQTIVDIDFPHHTSASPSDPGANRGDYS